MMLLIWLRRIERSLEGISPLRGPQLTLVWLDNMFTMVFALHDDAILLDWFVVGPGDDAEPNTRHTAQNEGIE